MIQDDGKIVLGGSNFHTPAIPSNPQVSHTNLVRLNPDGTIDDGFEAIVQGTTQAPVELFELEAALGGKFFIAGKFTKVNGANQNNLALLNRDGTLDAHFVSRAEQGGYIGRVMVQGDGKVLILGDFTAYDGIPRQGIARLNSDGTLDTSFDPGLSMDRRPFGGTLQSDGKILLIGDFTVFAGTERNSIARLNADGSLDDAFDPQFGPKASASSRPISRIQLSNQGKLLVAGSFTNIAEFSRRGIARLNEDGSLDPTFEFDTSVGPRDYINAIAEDSNNKLIVAGFIANLDGTGPKKFFPT